MNAIPTRYANVEFRSRLEARWAAFFDSLGWQWQYEPLDLRAYVPDFVLSFPAGPLLAEVKPCLLFQDLDLHIQKIRNSGWDGFALLLGATGPSACEYDPDNPALGLLLHARFKI